MYKEKTIKEQADNYVAHAGIDTARHSTHYLTAQIVENKWRGIT